MAYAFDAIITSGTTVAARGRRHVSLTAESRPSYTAYMQKSEYPRYLESLRLAHVLDASGKLDVDDPDVRHWLALRDLGEKHLDAAFVALAKAEAAYERTRAAIDTYDAVLRRWDTQGKDDLR